jgi:hypothetical protein
VPDARIKLFGAHASVEERGPAGLEVVELLGVLVRDEIVRSLRGGVERDVLRRTWLVPD